jgi:hypothetical protein
MIKGAAAMAEDARYLETKFHDAASSDLVPKGRMGSSSSCQSMILSLAAKHQVVDLVGNEFAGGSSSSLLRTWPTIESQGKMLLLPSSQAKSLSDNNRRRFDFAHLFETHKNYMSPRKQLGATVLPPDEVSCLEDVVELIEKQIVPALIQQSETLQQMQTTFSEVSKVFLVSSSSSASSNSHSGGVRAAVWSIGQPLHRVIIRKVLLEHILATAPAGGHGVSEEDIPNLVRNLQTMIVNMQVLSSYLLDIYDMLTMWSLHTRNFDNVCFGQADTQHRRSQHHLYPATGFVGQCRRSVHVPGVQRGDFIGRAPATRPVCPPALQDGLCLPCACSGSGWCC